jgi:manganese transport protein
LSSKKKDISWLRKWPLVFGPGLVFALSSIGPGDLITNSAAGAAHGYALIWALALALLFRAVWLSVSAKYVVVTGESLIQGYARIGRWLVWTILVATLLAGHLANLYMIIFSGNAVHMLLPLPTTLSAKIWSLLFVATGFSLMFWRGYKGVEKVCRGLITILGVSLVVAALRSNPDPAAIARGMLIPSIPISDGL